MNDVSGGTFDPDMLRVVAELGVPFVIMHMRGTPETMQSMASYTNVVEEVATTLRSLCRDAQQHGIHRWGHVVDPGIGFAKGFHENGQLLRNLSLIRRLNGGAPLLLGTSRKGFIGKLTGMEKPDERDYGSIASFVAPLSLEGHGCTTCNIVRVHNVPAAKQAGAVMDFILRG